MGVIATTVYSHHDVITVNEVFCRGDYRPPPSARMIVDVGSNIGISALYFLTRSPAVRVECFEPDPRNAERLRENLAAHEGRFRLQEEAVGDRDGMLRFGRESTGRYGAIGRRSDDEIEVRCRHVNAVLGELLEREPRIDFLKIDTEGIERETVAAIDRELLERIGAICLETREPLNPWPERCAMSFAAETCRLTAR